MENGAILTVIEVLTEHPCPSGLPERSSYHNSKTTYTCTQQKHGERMAGTRQPHRGWCLGPEDHLKTGAVRLGFGALFKRSLWGDVGTCKGCIGVGLGYESGFNQNKGDCRHHGHW